MTYVWKLLQVAFQFLAFPPASTWWQRAVGPWLLAGLRQPSEAPPPRGVQSSRSPTSGLSLACMSGALDYLEFLPFIMYNCTKEGKAFIFSDVSSFAYGMVFFSFTIKLKA